MPDNCPPNENNNIDLKWWIHLWLSLSAKIGIMVDFLSPGSLGYRRFCKQYSVNEIFKSIAALN